MRDRLALVRRPADGGIAFPLLRTMAGGLDLSCRLLGQVAPITPSDVDFLRHRTTFSNRKIRKSLGWTPAVPYDEAMRRTEEWLVTRYLKAR